MAGIVGVLSFCRQEVALAPYLFTTEKQLKINEKYNTD
jgi:hypothetical protein